MEIDGRYYVVANSPELVEKVKKIIYNSGFFDEPDEPYEKSFLANSYTELDIPNAKYQWFCYSTRTYELEEETLEECGKVLGNNGIVIADYSSSDYPEYRAYAHTAPLGTSAGEGFLPDDYLADFCEDIWDELSNACDAAEESSR